MAGTRAPLHIFQNTAARWVDTAAWPPSAQASTYYFGDGTLSTSRPDGAGRDTLAWAPASTANALTYTTAPLQRAVVLDGPSDVTVYASATATETELSATLNVLAPDGTVRKQADGALLGSQRRLDPATSWYGQDGVLLSPGHPFTQDSQQPVVPARTTPYDIALLPNFTLIPAGARIQLVLTSQPPASFHSPLAPTPQQLAHLAGGRYTVERGTLAASRLDLPLAPAARSPPAPRTGGHRRDEEAR